MLIFGAVDFTAALAKVAKVLGYRVTVCDAREVFATNQRFPMADDLVVDWPDRLLADIGGDLGPRDAVCILTHDAKFDVPAVTASLETKVGYIGVMGAVEPTTTEPNASSTPVSTKPALIASDRRSVSISGPARPRRQRSPSWRRSSRSAPAALLPPLPHRGSDPRLNQLGEGGGPIGRCGVSRTWKR